MAFTPKTWVETDPITAAELNRMEDGIDVAAAHAANAFVGWVDDAGAAVDLPAGWTCSRTSTGVYQVNISPALASIYYSVAIAQVAPGTPANVRLVAVGVTNETNFVAQFYNLSGALANCAGFKFLLIHP